MNFLALQCRERLQTKKWPLLCCPAGFLLSVRDMLGHGVYVSYNRVQVTKQGSINFIASNATLTKKIKS